LKDWVYTTSHHAMVFSNISALPRSRDVAELRVNSLPPPASGDFSGLAALAGPGGVGC
jgi:hypothetical protein